MIKKSYVFTGTLLTVTLSLGTMGIAVADPSAGDVTVTVADLRESGSASILLDQVHDDTVINEIGAMFEDTQMPEIVSELIGTPVNVDELAEVAEEVHVYASDGDIVDSDSLPEIDKNGEVSLPSNDGDGVFALSPVNAKFSASLGSAVVSDVTGADVEVISQVTENLDGQLIAVVSDEEVDYVDFSVEIPDGYTLTPFYGGFVLKNSQGELEGWIEPAWAVDADGTVLPTSYELTEGGEIRQNIDTTNATFPIVADPKATRASSGTCSKALGLYGIAHSTLWGAAVGGAAGIAVGAAYGVFWWGVTNYLC